jgi:hypothetical protein
MYSNLHSVWVELKSMVCFSIDSLSFFLVTLELTNEIDK